MWQNPKKKILSLKTHLKNTKIIAQGWYFLWLCATVTIVIPALSRWCQSYTACDSQVYLKPILWFETKSTTICCLMEIFPFQIIDPIPILQTGIFCRAFNCDGLHTTRKTQYFNFKLNGLCYKCQKNLGYLWFVNCELADRWTFGCMYKYIQKGCWNNKNYTFWVISFFIEINYKTKAFNNFNLTIQSYLLVKRIWAV